MAEWSGGNANGGSITYVGAPSGGDDTAALQAAADGGGYVVLKAGATYKLTGTTGLIIDPSKVKFVGLGVKIDASGMTSGTAVSFSGSANSFYRDQPLGGWEGIELVGPGIGSSVTGISVAGTGSGNGCTAIFSLLRSSVHDFLIGVAEGSNAWSINFIGIEIYNCGKAVDNSANTTNGGERMTYIGCDIHNNTQALNFPNTGGDHEFIACSFDFNPTLVALTGPHVCHFTDCHVEYRASTTAPVQLSGSLPLFVMKGGRWSQHCINTLSSGIASGVAITSLPVTSLQAPVTAGDTIVVMSASLNGTVDTFTASADAAVGATSIAVNSHAPTNSYSANALAVDTTNLPAYIVTNSASAGQNYGAYFDKVPMSGVATTNNAFVSGAPQNNQCYMNPNLADLSCVTTAGFAIKMPAALPGKTFVDGPMYENGSSGTISAGGTVTLDPTLYVLRRLTITTASAVTLAWANPISPAVQDLTVTIFNNSGGALGTLTWPSAINWAGWTWTSPATGKNRTARFQYDSSVSQWICQSVSPADY